MDQQTLHITPSRLSGVITVPPSKSHSLRALLFAMMAKSTSEIHNLLPSTDTDAMLEAITAFGTRVVGNQIEPKFELPHGPIDAKNSGLVYRFITAIGTLLPSPIQVFGDPRRPIEPLLYALKQLKSGKCEIDGADSQPVSALLIAASFLNRQSEIIVHNPGEKPWIDLTLYWLKKLGAKIVNYNYAHYFVKGGLTYPGFSYTVPGDYSSAAFPYAAQFITDSPLQIFGLDPNDVQGDKGFIELLATLKKGRKIDVNPFIDALPILAVVACFLEGETHIYNGAIARHKESDRISAICQELKKMGADIDELPDGLLVRGSPLYGADLEGHNDHRIAMSLAVAALGATSSSSINGIECIAKTYPSFISDFQSIGAEFELDPVWV